jgi:hypothetical protein
MTSDIQEQIERRRERARAEILKIANKGSHPVFSLFEVSSVSGKSVRWMSCKIHAPAPITKAISLALANTSKAC